MSSENTIEENKAYSIETFHPQEVVSAVRAGADHRLTNAIFC